MMRCESLTHDRLLDPSTPEIREHLDSCEVCRARAEELQALAEELRALGRTEPLRSDPALIRRVMQAAAGRPRRGIVRPASTWPWAAAAATILLALFLWHRSTPRQSESPIVSTAAPAPLSKSLPETPVRPVSVPAPAPVPAPALPEPPLPRPSAPEPPPIPTPTPPAPGPASPPSTPAPTPPPAPLPAPAPTRPAIARLTLSAVEGSLEAPPGRKVAAGFSWTAGDRLRAAGGSARFSLPDGTRVTMSKSSVLRASTAEPPEVSLESGAMLVEVIPGHAFAVATTDARFEVTGTRFSVRLLGHTELVVSSGEVAVVNDKGRTPVPAGAALAVRKDAAHGKPRLVDADALTSWAREMDPPERARFRFDLEDGKLPPGWINGKIAPGPARGLNRFCLEGGPGLDATYAQLDRKPSAAVSSLELRFRYWTADAGQITLQLFSDRIRDNFRFEVKAPAHGKWEQVRVPFSSLFRLSDGTHPQDDERFTWFNFAVPGAKGPLYIDDLELVEILR